MNLAPDFHATEDGANGEPEPVESVSPTVFVRTMSVPAGAPWDQARAAALEARVGAPLPLGEVVYQLKRLEPWALGRPARYAACYVRAKEVGEDFQTIAEVDGRSVAVRFLSLAERSRRVRRIAAVAGGAAFTAVLVLGAVLSALAVRSDLDDRLAGLEQGTDLRLRKAEAQEQLRDQSHALMAAHLNGHAMSDVLNDLAWASTNKVSGTHVDAIHWESGFMGVEVRGDGAPFVNGERTVTKVDKPLRPGVWLWGISPSASPKSMQSGAPAS